MHQVQTLQAAADTSPGELSPVYHSEVGLPVKRLPHSMPPPIRSQTIHRRLWASDVQSQEKRDLEHQQLHPVPPATGWALSQGCLLEGVVPGKRAQVQRVSGQLPMQSAKRLSLSPGGHGVLPSERADLPLLFSVSHTLLPATLHSGKLPVYGWAKNSSVLSPYYFEHP